MGSTRSATITTALAVGAVTLVATASTAFAGEATDAAADAAGTTTTTTTTTTGYHPVPAIFILGITCVVIGICLWFVFRYHQQLLATIDHAVKAGAAGPISAEDHGVGVQSREVTDGGVTITGPSTAVSGEEVTFTADGLTGGETLAWTVSGDVGADPAAGGDATFTTRFATAGTATVALDLVGGTAPAPLTVTVTAPASAPTTGAKGVVLPFVVRNWGRLVVVLFGAGLVGCLMALGVIGSEGGVALLGALLGVGAATAAPATGAAPSSHGGADDTE